MFNRLNQSQRQWVEQTLSGMTADEKIGQLDCEFAPRIMSDNSDYEAYLRQYPLGIIWIGHYGKPPAPGMKKSEAARGITGPFENKIRIPPIFCGDYESGLGEEIAGFTKVPRLMNLGATFDPAACYEFGRIMSEEARIAGINLICGTVSDLNLNPYNPVTNVRSIGDNAEYASHFLVELTKGIQDNGVAACSKHFPGDGVDFRNQHYVTSLNTLSREDWFRKHGRVFRALIDAGVMTMMIGHLGLPFFDQPDPRDGRYRPASLNRHILQDLLRGELGFEGLIMTDSMSMAGYSSWFNTQEERILESFNAGVDFFLFPGAEVFFRTMKRALEDGRVTMERIEESVRRILSVKALLNLHLPKTQPDDSEPLADMLERNRISAEQIAARSITLLRNKKGLLPLKLDKGAKILLLSTPDVPAGHGSMIPFWEELKKRGYEVNYLPFKFFHTVSMVPDAYDMTILICCAQSRYGDPRGFDSTIWAFMATPLKKRLIISFGTPYYLYDVDSADTYINAYSNSPVVQAAVIKAIFGEIPFQGHSPVSMPYCFKFGDGITCEEGKEETHAFQTSKN